MKVDLDRADVEMLRQKFPNYDPANVRALEAILSPGDSMSRSADI